MPLVEVIGWQEAIHQLGVDRLVDELASDRAVRDNAFKRFLDHFSESEKEAIVRDMSKKKPLGPR